MTYSKHKYVAALTCATLALGACKDNTGVPDLNSPSVSSVGGALDKGNLQILLTGILNQERGSLGYSNFVFPATLGRDVVRLDNSEARFETELLEGTPSPGGFLSGGFTPYYVAIRAENNLLAALPKATAQLSKGDTASIGGFVRTLKANDLYNVLVTRDTLGIPVDVADPTKIAPIRCKPAVLASLAALLDSGYAELKAAKAAGTTTIPATLPAGFTSIGGDYSQIDNLILYNRGLEGKILVYKGLTPGGSAQDFTNAVTALNIALAGVGTDAASLKGGPYFQFSTSSGEIANPLFDSRIHFTNAVSDSIKPGDLRASQIVTRSTPATLSVDGVNFSALYDPYNTVTANAANQTRPFPILRNDELYQLRAQAEIGLNNFAAAAADLNVVRAVEGGPALAPFAPFVSQKAAIDSLLYEKHYTLLTAGAQRLVDLRAYNRLNAASFPIGGPLAPYSSDPFNYAQPFPQAEIDTRGGNTKCQ